MKTRILRLLVLSLALIAVAYIASSPWLLALGANGMIMSLMALGAVRNDTLPRSLLRTFAGLFVLCAGCFLAALWLPAREGPAGPLFLGLPLRTAIILYGVGVLPMFVLPFAYAWTFHEFTLRDGDLQRVRDAADRVRASHENA